MPEDCENLKELKARKKKLDNEAEAAKIKAEIAEMEASKVKPAEVAAPVQPVVNPIPAPVVDPIVTPLPAANVPLPAAVPPPTNYAGGTIVVKNVEYLPKKSAAFEVWQVHNKKKTLGIISICGLFITAIISAFSAKGGASCAGILTLGFAVSVYLDRSRMNQLKTQYKLETPALKLPKMG